MKTIAAISTAPAVGGIGVIRISGEEALKIGEKVFSPKDKKKSISSLKGYTAAFGHIVKDGETIDECIATVFRAPHSYTGEDIVELSCHGGIFLLNKVLEFVIESGAEPAQAGEFTKRAFLNGKTDLTGAEAVCNIISSQGNTALRAALAAKDGNLYRKINEILHKLTQLSAHMSAWVDYPDDEIEELGYDNLNRRFTLCLDELKKLVKTFDSGQVVTEGINTVIAGRTNAGKSSLMNILCGENKSIVTDIEGTTRDVVEVSVRVGNAVLNLADTAGLRKTDDKVEKIGIDGAKKRINSAGFVLAVFDGSQRITPQDKELLEMIRDIPHIIVINKSDLPLKLECECFSDEPCVQISARDKSGIDELKAAVEKVLGTENFDPYAPLLANQRQRDCCKRAVKYLEEAIEATQLGMTMDAVNVSLDCSISALLELTGERATEKIVDNIFEQFCVGK